MVGNLLFGLAVSCGPGKAPGDSGGAPEARPPAPAVAPGAPVLRRLTRAQYDASIDDLLGPGLVLPAALEPDHEESGLAVVGAGVGAVSALGVERYEDAALSLAGQVVADPARRARVLSCTPEGPADAACAGTFAAETGALFYRRPLLPAEVERVAAVVTAVGADAGDFDAGLELGLAALLQSPHFLYRVEHGTPDAADPAQRRLTGPELATRLAFLLWGGPPDAPLLAAAAAGELATPEGRVAVAREMLDDRRAARGVRALFTDLLHLDALDTVEKDPLVYTHASPALAAAAREETLRVIESLALDGEADFLSLLSLESTFVDRRLAALYGLPAPDIDGWGAVALSREGGRRGLLGHASILLLESHATRSSATMRGVFVRKTLLCQVIPPPPADVDTSLPEGSVDAPTLRERIAPHLEDPTCAGCHRLTDPIGLGLETFDGVGRFRSTENGASIDASGELDGRAFADAWGLASAVRGHPNLGPCMVTHLYEAATGRVLAAGEAPLRDWLADGFSAGGNVWSALLLDLIASPGFDRVGALE